MRIVLKQDVPGVGKANEVQTVSDGYARNYLIPQGLAVLATDGQVKAAKKQRQTREVQSSRRRERAEEIAAQLEKAPLHFTVKAGDKGRLYGSITNADVAKAISRVIGSDFDRRWLDMERPIREIGTHIVDLKLQEGVRGQAQVIVTAEDQ